MLCGCVPKTPPLPTPADTEFNETHRDWLQVYLQEIKVAVDNDDEEAYHFFMHEYLQERVRIWKLNKGSKNSPKN